MEYYNYSAELPFSKKSLNFREINTKEQLVLAKANLSFPNNKNNSFEFNNFVIKTIKNCLEKPEEIDDINIIDYVLFLTKLRILSIGGTIELVSESENKEVKSIKTTIDLNIFLRNLYEACNEAFVEDVITENDIEVKLGWPTLNSISIFQYYITNNKSQYETFSETFQEFVEYVKVKDKKIIFKHFTSEQKSQFLERLSVSLIKKIQETIIESLKFLNQYDLWEISTFKQHTFNFYSLNFIDFIRLFFSYDVKSLYKEIYYFISSNIQPDYIMSISSAERKIYYSIIEEQKRLQNKETGYDFDQINSKASTDLEDLALEFGDTPP